MWSGSDRVALHPMAEIGMTRTAPRPTSLSLVEFWNLRLTQA